jgi:four helix bundle protein
MINKSFQKLKVYVFAFELAMDIYRTSRNFPEVEKYSLTTQIRRSSRSVCSCIAEAYRKRMYRSYFLNKLSDADMENSETQVWIEFARACNYIDINTADNWYQQTSQIGRLISYMMHHPARYGGGE